MKRFIVSADDFGLSESVNEAVECAHRDGLLGAASLMVAGSAAGDAVRRAKRLPYLRIGLHLVVIEGPAVLPLAQIPDLVDAGGRFPSGQVWRGIDYFFRPQTRRQLAAEIRGQFMAFAATGLPLDHANAHKHMHLHPTVGRLMIRIGRDFGLRAVRIPVEPPAVLAACGTRPAIGVHALFHWTAVLRRQARRARLLTNDYCFGIAWSGGMTTERLLQLIPRIPDGLSEIYFHPASRADPAISEWMPGYDHRAELAALLDPEVRRLLHAAGRLTSYGAELSAIAS